MLNRPLICTEYMARRNDSRFCNVLPLMKKEKVGAINWGFVAGKTNTIFAWDDVIPSGEEPELWFHDIYRPTGVPYQQEEVDCIQSLTGKNRITYSFLSLFFSFHIGCYTILFYFCIVLL